MRADYVLQVMWNLFFFSKRNHHIFPKEHRTIWDLIVQHNPKDDDRLSEDTVRFLGRYFCDDTLHEFTKEEYAQAREMIRQCLELDEDGNKYYKENKYDQKT